MKRKMTKLLLGIDGGGSKTDFLICDLQYNEIARRIAGPSNPNDIGIQATADLIADNVSALISENGIDSDSIVAAFAGIAGLTYPNYSTKIKDVLSSLLPQARVDALHDGINVLYGAFPESDGVSIICGTGSSCFVKQGKEIYRIGGYGSYDMAGNGYEIGKRAIAHALKAYDGRERNSLLAKAVEEKIGTNVLDGLNELLALGKDEIAAFAPIVFQCAEQGDKTAMIIIFENISYVAELIARAGEYFDGDYPVSLAGGIMKSSYARDLLETMLEPGAIVSESKLPPAFGAAAKAYSLIK